MFYYGGHKINGHSIMSVHHSSSNHVNTNLSYISYHRENMEVLCSIRKSPLSSYSTIFLSLMSFISPSPRMYKSMLLLVNKATQVVRPHILASSIGVFPMMSR